MLSSFLSTRAAGEVTNFEGPSWEFVTDRSRGDWRAPTDGDSRRLRTLLRDLMIHLRTDAGMFEQAEQDLCAIGGESWTIGIGSYPQRADRCRELASWVEDEYRALRGGPERQVALDDRGMFPGTPAP